MGGGVGVGWGERGRKKGKFCTRREDHWEREDHGKFLLLWACRDSRRGVGRFRIRIATRDGGCKLVTFVIVHT